MLTTKQKSCAGFGTQPFRLTTLKLDRSRFVCLVTTLCCFSMPPADRRR